MLNIGLLGADLIGKQHAGAIHEVNGLRVCGIFDPETDKAKKVASKLQVPFFNNPEDLIRQSDALDITSATDSFFSFIPGSLKASRHLLLPPAVLKSKVLGDNLLKLSREANTKIQIGYTDRFRSVLLSAMPFIYNPLFIDVQHNIPFITGNSSEPELEEIMIGDIDIILSVVKANIKKVHATGINVFGDKADIINTHLEFDNGTNVNLTLNSIAGKNVHCFQFYKTNLRVECDFVSQSAKVYEKKGKKLFIKTLNTPPNHPLTEAFTAFYNSITYNSEPIVGITEGCQVRNIAHQVSEKIKVISKAG